MIKNLLVLLLCLGLSGCVSYEYTATYYAALKAKTSITITQEENYQELKQRVAGYFESRGYKNIIFEDQKKGFFVLAKDGDYGLSCQIILKYTQKAGADKIRIDLVKGSDDIVTDSDITADIQAIAEKIRASRHNLN